MGHLVFQYYLELISLVLQLRYLIVNVLVLGIPVGLTLAFNVERPIRRVTPAIYGLSRSDWSGSLSEQDPEEIRLLLRAVNHIYALMSEPNRPPFSAGNGVRTVYCPRSGSGSQRTDRGCQRSRPG
jgi:hypothetical protein